jgi:hypothetical protein
MYQRAKYKGRKERGFVKEIGNVNVYAVVVAVGDCVTELSEQNLGVTLS